MKAIINHAKSQGMALTVTFIDLQNAFGSVPHKPVSDYISSAYSQLQAFIFIKNWSTPAFPTSKTSEKRKQGRNWRL